MSDTPAVPIVNIPAPSKKTKKVLIVILVIVLIAVLVYYFFWPHMSMKKAKSMISVESAGYSDPASVENILLQGVKEIRWDRQLYRQAKIYAKAQNMEIERVIVDSAVAIAKNVGYIQ